MSKGIIAATGKVRVVLIDDRIHATIASDQRVETWAFKLDQAEVAALKALDLIAEYRAKRTAKVLRFPRKGPPIPHG